MKQFLVTLIITFLLLTGTAFYLNSIDPAYDVMTLILANALLAVVTFISFNMIYNGIKRKQGESMYRAKIGSTMLKFFVIIGAVLLYVVTREKGMLHRSTIMSFAGAYIIYMVLETIILSKIARTAK
ncbi:MAG: hypothetical protein BGO09_07670 [Bacteroidetes bacterium 47-18]|nr:MAG: hypothetical protein BGO09_07670 [Bacteroidetes bacterium 47-18]